MSKGKRGKSNETKPAATGAPRWESGLVVAPYETDTWKMNIYLLVGARYEDEANIEACCTAVAAGQRRLFSLISKPDLYAKVRELGNPKMNKGKKDIPAYSEICESCLMILETGDELPVSLQARLIKWRLLDIKEMDMKRRDAEKKKEAAAAGGGGGKRGKSPAKKGKKTPEPGPTKAGSKVKKRSEEERDKDYIDDEPDDGPQHYVFIRGFHNIDLVTALNELNIDLAAIIKVSTEDYCIYPEYIPPHPEELTEAEEITIKNRVTQKKDIYRFWNELRTILDKQPEASSLHQTPEMEYVVKNAIKPLDIEDSAIKMEFGTVLFEDIACIVYNLIDSKRQHRAYLDHLHLTVVPTILDPVAIVQDNEFTSPSLGDIARDGTPITNKWDMRYYNDLMRGLPQECVSIPLIVHCMLEQIVATENGTLPPSEVISEPRPDDLDHAVAAHLNHLVSKLALTDHEHEALTDAFDMVVRSQDQAKPPQIINHSDELTNRTEYLKVINEFNPLEIEMKMLDFSAFHDMPIIEKQTSAQQRLQAVRLQELLHFCSSPDLTISEIDHYFRQFVFENMDVAVSDLQGFVTSKQQEGVHRLTIPWDDPYICLKGHHKADGHDKTKPLSASDKRSQSSGSETGSARESTSLSLNKDRPSRSTSRRAELKEKTTSPKSDDKTARGKETSLLPRGESGPVCNETGAKDDPKKLTGILRPLSKSRCSSANSVRFEPRDDLGHPTMDSTDITDELSVDSEKKSASNAERILDLLHLQQRSLDEWCFTEHFTPHILKQVLTKAAFSRPYMDTYHHQRDHSLLVILHNPTSTQLKIVQDWKTELYSNLGFRKYMDIVASKVTDWMHEEDARYSAQRLSLELEKLNLEQFGNTKTTDRGGAKSRGSAKSAKKKSPKSSRTTSTERTFQEPDDIFKRPVSLKYQKAEQEKLKAEEEEKERAKMEKRKSPVGKKEKKEDKGGKKSASTRSSSKTKLMKEPTDLNIQSDDPGPEEPVEKYWPFSGYNMGDRVINMSGMTTSMFPSDGGQIRVERTDILNGTTSVKCSVLKDEHVFVIHILEPRDTPEPPQDPEVIEYERRKQEEKSLNDSDNQDLGIIDLTESLIEQKDLPPRPSVSAFASITARFSDGMCLAFSTFGPSGRVDDESKKAVETPTGSVAASPVPLSVRDQPPKGKKLTAREREKTATPEPMMMDLPAMDDVKPIEQPFHSVQVSCPDGLIVNYMLESSLGITPMNEEDRRLLVKMSYPYTMSGEQDCEAVRYKYSQIETARIVSSDGTVYKFMVDGTCEVLFADGTICKTIIEDMTNAPSPTTLEQPAKLGDRIESPKKSSRSGRSLQSEKPLSPAPEEKVEDKSCKWIKTLPNGERMFIKPNTEVTHLSDVLLYVASDPQTKKSMATRDDNVVTVSDVDGTLIVEHADGTRITTYYRANNILQEETLDTGEEIGRLIENIKFVKIECPGYATVEYNCSTSETLTRFGNGSSLNVYSDGYYMLHHASGGKFEIDVEGVTVYYPQPSRYLEQLSAERESVYVMRHNAEVICETADPEGNIFQARFSGECQTSVVDGLVVKDDQEMSESISDSLLVTSNKVVEYRNHAPRFFIIHPDGSGTELLRYEDVAEYLMDMEDDKNTAVIHETLPEQPSISSITVLKPYPSTPSDLWRNEYDLKSIIPDGIRNRDLTSLPPREFVVPGPKYGHTVGRGLSVATAVKGRGKGKPSAPVIRCPSKLEVRQLLQYKSATTAIRTQLAAGLRNYANHIEQRKQLAERIKPTDERPLTEQRNAEYLQNIALSMKQISERQPVQLSALYEEVLAPRPASPPPGPPPKRTQADWERDLREIQEEKEQKEILSKMIVPPYFQSELGRAYILSEAKDVSDLLREISLGSRTPGATPIVDSSESPGVGIMQEGSLRVTGDFPDRSDIERPQSFNVDTPIMGRKDGDPKNRRQPSETPDGLVLKYGIHAGISLMPSLSRNETETSLGIASPMKDSANALPVGIITSATRPHNPTPTHALGSGSPRLLRPMNPTPNHSATDALEKNGQDGVIVDSVSMGYHSVKGQPIAEEHDLTPDPALEDTSNDSQSTLQKTALGVNASPSPITLPRSVKGGRPGSIPNSKFLQIEEPVRRKVLNTGVIGGTPKGIKVLRELRGLNIHPEKVHFGVLKEGNTYSHKVYLKNTGVDSCRFKLKQPPLSTGITVIYKPGPIAAGMTAELNLEIYAIASSSEEDGALGQICHQLSITTETNTMYLPITATVLTAHEFTTRCPNSERGKSPGTLLVSTTPPALTGIIRPRKCGSNNGDVSPNKPTLVT